MSGANFTYQMRCRAVQAVVEEALSSGVVARAYGVDRTTLYRWLARYRQGGNEGAFSRRPVSGCPKKLESLDVKALREIVPAPASQYGYDTDFWTTRRLSQVIRSRFQVPLSKQTVLRMLHAAGLTYQKPEREYWLCWFIREMDAES